MTIAYKILFGTCVAYSLAGFALAGSAAYKLHKIEAAKKAPKN